MALTPGGAGAPAPGVSGERASEARLAPLWLEWVVVIGLFATFVWRGLLPAWASLNTDFPNYYLAARVFHDGFPLDRIYDWIWFQRQKDHAGLEQGLVGCIEMSPFSALVLVPLLFLPALAAKQVWTVVNLVFLLITGALLRRMSRLPWRQVALMILLCVVPLRTNFTFGQQHILILVLLTIAAWFHFERRSLMCGLTLALAAAFKVYPALFLLYFVRKKQWRAAIGLLVGLLALGLFALGIFGGKTLWVYGGEILPRILKGEGNEPYLVTSNSPTVLLRRLFVAEPELNPHPLVHAPIVFAILQPIIQTALLIGTLWFVRTRQPGSDAEKVDWAAFTVLLLILSPGSSTYHFCVLILAGTLLLGHLLLLRDIATARVATAIYALTCLPIYRFFPAAPSGWMIFLGFPRLYALTGLFGLFLPVLARLPSMASAGAPRGVRTRQGIVALSIFVGLSLVAIVAQLRHVHGLFADYASRVAGTSGSLITTTPSIAGDDIYFTRMESDGYGVGRTGALLDVTIPPLTDIFSPAVTTLSPKGWLELASFRSKVVRFSRADAHFVAAHLPVEVDDAEQPVVSSDGHWLAVLREVRGRGGLWIVDRRANGSANLPRQLVESEKDVLDFGFFPDGRVVLSARPEGRPELFVVDPVYGQVAPWASWDAPVRYPAVSPDGRWLVGSLRERANWQLAVANLSSGERRQITHADCNSVRAAWSADSRSVVYATDCGRAIGQTAISRLTVVP